MIKQLTRLSTPRSATFELSARRLLSSADTVSFTVHIPTNKGVLPVAFEHLRRDQACSQLSRLLNRWHAVAIAKLDVHGHLILPLLAPLPAIIPEDGSQYEILCAGDPVPQLVKSLRSRQTSIDAGSEHAATKLLTHLLSDGGDAKPFRCKTIKGEGDHVIVEINAAATSEQLQRAVIAQATTCLTSGDVGQLCLAINRIRAFRAELDVLQPFRGKELQGVLLCSYITDHIFDRQALLSYAQQQQFKIFELSYV